MTRTDVMASSRPRTAGAAPKRNGSRATRWLTVLPIVLMLGMALFVPASALAATETNASSGYESEPNRPETETKPSKETEPSKEKSEPTSEATPTTTTAPEKTLPFTGFDLRWSFGIGLLLMAAGFSIVVVQRRQRREGGR